MQNLIGVKLAFRLPDEVVDRTMFADMIRPHARSHIRKQFKHLELQGDVIFKPLQGLVVFRLPTLPDREVVERLAVVVDGTRATPPTSDPVCAESL